MKTKVKAKIKWLLTRYRAFRLRLRHIDSTAYIAKGKHAIHRSFVMEPYSYIGGGSLVGPNVRLGSYAMVGPHVRFVGDDHVFANIGVPIIFSGRPPVVRPTEVGKDAWIGCGCTILAGCTIGDGSVVAAGSVVTKDIPAGVIVAGIPAKVIRNRFDNEEDWLRHKAAIEDGSIGSGGHYIAPSSPFR